MKIKCLLSAIVISSSCLADVAVIVHPSNNNVLDSSIVSRIFLGKEKSFADGNQTVPVNQEEGNAVTEEFNADVLNKSSSQLKAYWSKLVFTGKGSPPIDVANDADVIKLIATNPNMIGYVDASKVDDSVKVVGTF
ncbi:phosphate ABC transporter substrate-binding protein [Paraglaciecola sp.]|uniref:phosphate ABC transporter substrate-binding protein n=1 Tax=Paraglaciecola sp. TaxID=1920173 RepID=UPI0030F3D010